MAIPELFPKEPVENRQQQLFAVDTDETPAPESSIESPTEHQPQNHTPGIVRLGSVGITGASEAAPASIENVRYWAEEARKRARNAQQTTNYTRRHS